MVPREKKKGKKRRKEEVYKSKIDDNNQYPYRKMNF